MKKQWFVEVVLDVTQEVVERIKCKGGLEAEKVERGLCINLNHSR